MVPGTLAGVVSHCSFELGTYVFNEEQCNVLLATAGVRFHLSGVVFTHVRIKGMQSPATEASSASDRE
jgi:hypothetical protein